MAFRIPAPGRPPRVGSLEAQPLLGRCRGAGVPGCPGAFGRNLQAWQVTSQSKLWVSWVQPRAPRQAGLGCRQEQSSSPHSSRPPALEPPGLSGGVPAPGGRAGQVGGPGRAHPPHVPVCSLPIPHVWPAPWGQARQSPMSCVPLGGVTTPIVPGSVDLPATCLVRFAEIIGPNKVVD